MEAGIHPPSEGVMGSIPDGAVVVVLAGWVAGWLGGWEAG